MQQASALNTSLVIQEAYRAGHPGMTCFSSQLAHVLQSLQILS